MLLSNVLVFPRYHFLFDIFNRKLQQYFEGGFTNFNTKVFREYMNPKRFEIFEKPFAVLTLIELEAGFVVCMLPLLFSIIVFSLEWLTALKDLTVFLFIFKRYFRMKMSEQKARFKIVKAVPYNYKTMHESKTVK